MSIAGKSKGPSIKIGNKKNILNEKVRKLIYKVEQLEKVHLQNPNSPQFIQHFSQFERIVENLQNKINRLEQKNTQLESSIKEIKKIKPTSTNSTDEVKILNNVINEDLNKLKIKIEKNESIIKRILFN